jgi:hypothetical protein
MWAANNAAGGRWSGSYVLEFANQGNAPTRLAVNGRDPAAALTVTIEQELIDLSPGGRTSTRLKAKARQPFLRGTPQNRIIEVHCRKVPFGVLPPEAGGRPDPTDPDQRTLQLTFQQKPVLSKLMLVGLVLAGALLLALIVLRLRQTDELSLDLAAPEAPAGFAAQASGSTAVVLRWDAVPNALGYQIRETTNTGEMGAEVASLDATARTYTDEELEPGSEHCYALIAIGPEGAANSAPTPHQCVTTGLPSGLDPPADLVATPEGGGAFTLAWTYPNTEGVEFTVVVDGARRPDRIVGLTTRIVLDQREAAYQAVVAVEAVRGEEFSDPSPPQTVTVDAALGATTTSVAPTTLPGGGTTIAVPPPPPPGATTTTSSATTTTVATPASSALQDIATTPAAFLGRYTPESQGGLPIEQRKNDLALAFNIPVTDIGVFTNRDTRVRDAVGTGGDLANVAPNVSFFYVSRPTVDDAGAVCTQNPTRTCGTFTVQGAASAAEGTTVVVVDRLAATTPIDDLDARLTELRADLETQNVFALDGGEFQGFSANEVIVYVSDLGTPQQIDQFCAQQLGGTCARGVLTRLP